MDPRWIIVKFPGKDKQGKPLKRGDRALFFPRSKTLLSGPEAEQAWREFKSQVEDEDFFNRSASSMGWDLLEGPALEKVKRIFEDTTENDWYVSSRKILGKSIFMRDHGVKTLYVAGVDGRAYSLKHAGFDTPLAHLQELVNAAMTGDTSEDKIGVYRNFAMKQAKTAAFDRKFYLPAEVRDLPPNVDAEGTDLEVWTYTYDKSGAMVFGAIAFAGKQSKPLWHYSYRSEASMQTQINQTIAARKSVMKAKAEAAKARKEFKTDLEVGDLLYSSWGYDQTNVDWYQVVEKLGTMVVIREIAGRQVGSDGYSDKVVPVPDHFVGPPQRKRPNRHGIPLTSYSSAYKWDGKPKHQTNANYGH